MADSASSTLTLASLALPLPAAAPPHRQLARQPCQPAFWLLNTLLHCVPWLQIVMDAVDKPRNVQFKGATDLVTDTDTASEAAILAVLQSAFPGHAVLGEEGGVSGAGPCSKRLHRAQPQADARRAAHWRLRPRGGRCRRRGGPCGVRQLAQSV